MLLADVDGRTSTDASCVTVDLILLQFESTS